MYSLQNAIIIFSVNRSLLSSYAYLSQPHHIFPFRRSLPLSPSSNLSNRPFPPHHTSSCPLLISPTTWTSVLFAFFHFHCPEFTFTFTFHITYLPFSNPIAGFRYKATIIKASIFHNSFPYFSTSLSLFIALLPILVSSLSLFIEILSNLISLICSLRCQATTEASSCHNPYNIKFHFHLLHFHF